MDGDSVTGTVPVEAVELVIGYLIKRRDDYETMTKASDTSPMKRVRDDARASAYGDSARLLQDMLKQNTIK